MPRRSTHHLRPRADWDDGYGWYSPYTPGGFGTVHDLGDTSDTGPSPAVIWLPDPEQRRGWREYYVPGDPKPSGKPPMGFRPRKG